MLYYIYEREEIVYGRSTSSETAQPAGLPTCGGAVRIELEEGVPIFRASDMVQERIATLLFKQQSSQLSAEEEQELDQYQELDDYLSFLNRIARNLFLG